jgi:membrane protein DedA with SNARE-associated domain
MFHHLVDTILNYVDSGSSLITTFLFPIVFVAALSESTPILGTFTPGTLFLLFFGYAASVHSVNVALVVLVATLGAIMGDILGYMLGRYAGDWLVRNKKILKQVHIEQGRGFFSRNGGKSILIGRFIGPIRPIVPLIAGSIGMSFRKFLFWNILGAFLWAAVYVTLGYFFGAYARQIEAYVSDASWAILALVVLAGGLYYYSYYTKKHAKREKIHH